MRRAVRDYKYEISEERMSDECVQYLTQLQKDWERHRVKLGVKALRKEVWLYIFYEMVSTFFRLSKTIAILMVAIRPSVWATLRPHPPCSFLATLLHHQHVSGISTCCSIGPQTRLHGNPPCLLR